MRTLTDCLMKKTLEDLTDIGFRLLVTPPAHRRSKAAWAEVIVQALQDEPQSFHPALSGTQWEDLSSMMEAMPDTKEEFTISQSDVVKNQMDHLIARLDLFGLAWKERRIWHVNAAMLRPLMVFSPEEGKALSAAEDLFDIFTGYLLLYGLILYNDLLVMLNLSDQPETAEAALSIWRTRNGLDGTMVENGKLWLLCPDAADPARLYAARMDQELSQLSYQPMTPEEAQALSGTLLPGNPRDAEKIRAFLTHRGMTPEEINCLLIDMTEDIQNGDNDGALNLLSGALKSLPTPDQVKMIGDYINSIPRWELKGHSYAELKENAVSTPKPKQNDPCPCGSGRKYKNCCGRLQ